MQDYSLYHVTVYFKQPRKQQMRRQYAVMTSTLDFAIDKAIARIHRDYPGAVVVFEGELTPLAEVIEAGILALD